MMNFKPGSLLYLSLLVGILFVLSGCLSTGGTKPTVVAENGKIVVKNLPKNCSGFTIVLNCFDEGIISSDEFKPYKISAELNNATQSKPLTISDEDCLDRTFEANEIQVYITCGVITKTFKNKNPITIKEEGITDIDVGSFEEF